MLSFHRPGTYAINFGLGTDNQLRTGGWSRGGNFVVLDSGNYNSYAPTLGGSGASGTWGISISGNAATATSATSATSAASATNATNATNSTFASNPASGGSFITSSNIGSQSVNFANSATNATNAVNATNASTAASINTGNFTVFQSGSRLYFQYNGVSIASLDSSGNFISLNNVTAYGAP
jgi:hypothetical protein